MNACRVKFFSRQQFRTKMDFFRFYRNTNKLEVYQEQIGFDLKGSTVNHFKICVGLQLLVTWLNKELITWLEEYKNAMLAFIGCPFDPESFWVPTPGESSVTLARLKLHTCQMKK